jgi:anti-anti-sigma regulatory factor
VAAPESKSNPTPPAEKSKDDFDPYSIDFTKLNLDEASVMQTAATITPVPAPAVSKPVLPAVEPVAALAPITPTVSAATKVPLELLDFTALSIDDAVEVEALAPVPAKTIPTQPPAVAPVPSAPVATSTPPAKAVPQLNSLASSSVLIDVARQHAAGKTIEAAAALEAALRGGMLGRATEQGWNMLFDLLQILGRRQAFENLADAYAKRFERSAPAWLDADGSADTRVETGGASVALSGVLSAASAGPLKKLAEIAQNNPVVRLGLQKVTDADNDGCRLLLDMLRAIKKAGGECLLGAAADFAALLAGKVEVMRREREETWLLLLELYLRTGDQLAFEDAAVNYAVTFEVSPPSWEVPKTAKVASLPVAKSTDPFVFEGELLAGTGRIDALLAAANGRDAFTLEAERLTRVDEVAARLLREALAPLHARGVHIRMRGINLPVATLLAASGLDRIVDLEIRRR